MIVFHNSWYIFNNSDYQRIGVDVDLKYCKFILKDLCRIRAVMWKTVDVNYNYFECLFGFIESPCFRKKRCWVLIRHLIKRIVSLSKDRLSFCRGQHVHISDLNCITLARKEKLFSRYLLYFYEVIYIHEIFVSRMKISVYLHCFV